MATKFFPQSGQVDLGNINYYKEIPRFYINIDIIEGELISVLRKLLNRKALGLDRILNKALKKLKKKKIILKIAKAIF